ncbi:hypothetical protein ACIGB8_10185 [Promicromonospora sukumoe]|uniref:DUF7507 domain-containing protein n=1 Tax=Promicromonospora sukumoe TaxID=88382 RepID=UPI0037CB837E
MRARRSTTRTTQGRYARRRRGRVPAVLAALSLVGAGLVATSLTAVTPSAVAAPGNPGVPGEPTVLFVEDFENRAADSNVLLTDYTGADGTTYTADPFWVDRNDCNGFIINQTSTRVPGDCNGSQPDTFGAATFTSLTAMPHALGTINGTDPASNAAASSYTSGNDADNLVQFATAAPLTLTTEGRFVTFSVDAVAQNCQASHPELRFYLVDGSGTEIPVSSSAIDPCTDPRGAQFTSPTENGTTRLVTGGRFPADGSTLVTGGSFGIVMRNENGNGGGNDGAYDNIRVLDVTPQLDKEFSPTSVATGGVSTLTLTITNTSDLAAKNGWSFTDTLPEGLVVADPSAVATTCPAGDVTAAAGATAVEATGNLDAGMASCTITVNVTSDEAGSYTNGPDNISAIGLDFPDTSTVTFGDPSLELVKTAGDPVDVNENGITDTGDTIAYTFEVTNTGDVAINDLAIDDPKVGAITCEATSVEPGDTVTCTTDEPYVVTDEDVEAGSVDNSATATGTPPGTDTPIGSPPSETSTPTEAPDPGIEVVKSATPSGPDSYTVGQEITYNFEVTNTGNVPLSDVTVDETEFTGTGEAPVPACPADVVLAPGDSLTCTATYVITQADVDAGEVTNSATATGTPPGDTPPPESPPSTVEIPSTPEPGIEVVKTSDTEEISEVGQEITYSFAVTNTGNVTLTDVEVDDSDFSGSGDLSPVECPAEAASLLPGASVTCTATYVVTQADLDAGTLSNTATATGTPPGSTPPPESPPSTVDIPGTPAPGIEVVKTSDTKEITRVGQKVTYSFEVTNTGNVALADVTVDDSDFSGTGELSPVECPAEAADLAPGASVTCTATYVVTAADLDAGELTNTATATGTPPGGVTPPTSPPSTATVPVDPDEPAPPAPGGSGGPGGSLASTGANPAWTAGFAALLMLTGAAAMLAVRRRAIG